MRNSWRSEVPVPDDGRRFGACLTMFGFILLFGACRDKAPLPGDSTNLAAPIDSSPKVSTAEPLRALGTEPFWALDIDSTGVHFKTPADTTGTRFPPNAPIPVAGDTLVWMGETESTAIHVRIWPERCSDGMSDRVYPYTAIVRVAGTDYRGCADRKRAIVAR